MMPFDIHQSVFDEGEYLEEEAFDYRDKLMEMFAASPEGQELIRQTGRISWADTFMDYGMSYLGVTPAEMSPQEVEEVLFDLFPRKVSADPGAGEEAVRELHAFWAFLQREFQLPNAGACLRMLTPEMGRRVDQEMQNPANFGMAKSFVMLGRQSGFDMTTQEGVQAFTEIYNASLPAAREPLLPLPDAPYEPSAPSSHRAPKARAARRKIAQKSRQKNRKKR